MSEENDQEYSLEKLWLRVNMLAEQLNKSLGITEKAEKCKTYAKEHPFISLFLIINLAMSSIPVICFVSFAVGTIVLMLMGFLCIEGLFLTIGAMILGGVLVIMTSLSALICGSAILAYFAYLGAQRAAAAAGQQITTRYECWRGQGCETKIPEDIGISKEKDKSKVVES